MKVKLLKKVRKRYTVTRVDQISLKQEHDQGFYKESKDKYGLPFFVFRDNNDDYGLRRCSFGTKENAIKEVLERIIRDYTTIVKKREGKESTVWYPKQHK